jgi:hypothetical protein
MYWVIELSPLWDLYVGIVMNVKHQRLLCDLYASITMNAKNQRLLWDVSTNIAYLKMALWNL